MVKLVLVAGLIPYESGKTWFTLGSALSARNHGLRVEVFKPVAGHNLWYSPRAVEKTLKLKLLVGNDVAIYYDNKFIEDPAIANPIALATAPPDPTRYLEKIDEYLRILEETYSITVLSRITSCHSRTIRHNLYYENLEKTSPSTRRFVEKLALVLKAEKSSLPSLLNYMSSSSVDHDLNKCLELIEKRCDIVFVESFNDAITPYAGLLERTNLIAVVAPSRVFVYENSSKLREVLENNVKKLGLEGFRAKFIVGDLRPDTILNIEFTPKPKEHKVHKEFVNYILKKT
ncbi:MAG: hypothetical protein QXN57_01720 [Desulfurococcaceae archaeon]